VAQEHLAIRKMKQSDVPAYKGAEVSADARLLGLQFQGVMREERRWRDVSKELQKEELPDWTIPGPRAAEWCVRFLNRRNGAPTDHHRWRVQNHGLKSEGLVSMTIS